MVRTIAGIHEELQTSKLYREVDALAGWFGLTCHKAMDFDLLQFLRDEIRLQDPEVVACWQHTLCRLLSRSIAEAMPASIPVTEVINQLKVELAAFKADTESKEVGCGGG